MISVLFKNQVNSANFCYLHLCSILKMLYLKRLKRLSIPDPPLYKVTGITIFLLISYFLQRHIHDKSKSEIKQFQQH